MQSYFRKINWTLKFQDTAFTRLIRKFPGLLPFNKKWQDNLKLK
jgi:hypothetical protein